VGEYVVGQPFPDDDATSRGETLTITGPQVDAFRKGAPLIVKVVPVRRSTTTGPFAHMAEVRVTRVRVYLKGATVKAGRYLNLTVTHSGPESIVGADDQLYTFTHVPRSSTFAYDPKDESIYVDSTFQIATAPDAPKNALALLGPFATWVVQLNNRDAADLSKLTQIELDFRGFQVPFAPFAAPVVVAAPAHAPPTVAQLEPAPA
jgi:hypothetical protein